LFWILFKFEFYAYSFQFIFLIQKVILNGKLPLSVVFYSQNSLLINFHNAFISSSYTSYTQNSLLLSVKQFSLGRNVRGLSHKVCVVSVYIFTFNNK